VGKEEKIKEQIKNIGYSENFDIEIVNSKDEEKRNKYVKHLFQKLQREQGFARKRLR
jgi:malate dehydrogenase (oxaloacetate-decarboxylating)(NADP+)